VHTSSCASTSAPSGSRANAVEEAAAAAAVPVGEEVPSVIADTVCKETAGGMLDVTAVTIGVDERAVAAVDEGVSVDETTVAAVVEVEGRAVAVVIAAVAVTPPEASETLVVFDVITVPAVAVLEAAAVAVAALVVIGGVAVTAAAVARATRGSSAVLAIEVVDDVALPVDNGVVLRFAPYPF
jgi:hypothetical protein